MIFVILLLFCARFVNSFETGYILTGSDRVSANGNSTVRLDCTVQNLGTNQLSWAKKINNNSEQLYIGVNNISFLQNKYQLGKEGDKFVLKIYDVNPEDSGTYICSVSMSANKVISKDILLTVRTPPSILENTTATETARINTATKLVCLVSGVPPPKVTWTREDNGLLPTGKSWHEGSTLYFPSVRKEHAGVYFCTAKNEVNDVKKTYKLNVEFGPEIEVEKKRVGQALQHKAELECRITAYPDPVISWYRGNSQITNYEPNYKLDKSTLPNAVTISKLVITAVNRTQYGNYTCKADNLLSQTQQSIEFYETHEEQCYPPTTCGSWLEYPDFKLIFSTTCMLVFVFRW